VSGRNALDFQARINLDKWYIQNWSLWLDLIILIKTIKVVLLGRDAR
jgi:undecaprenyl-phosphate galactose phosphotransferase